MGEMIDSHVSMAQCRKAIEALLAYAHKKEDTEEQNALLPAKAQNIWLQIAVKKMYPEKTLKPFRIPLAYPILDPRETPICLITKDPQREYKDLIESHNIKFISRVVGITKLKGKFKPFEARRLLLKENGMFLADERVIPLLPGLLGKKWFEAKKQPIPVCMTRKNLKDELERAVTSTYMHQNQGTCTSVKIGSLDLDTIRILANLYTGLPVMIKHIKGGWDNIQSLSIKTSTSMSLPLWTCTLGEENGGRWDGLIDAGVEEEASEAEDSEDMEVEAAPSTKGKAETKSRKRASEDEGQEKPKKKLK
ncbi:hypothetical protein PLICRDRAFT_158208, partial [Plicaturopsis crispa FD-325 SS-3]